MFVAIFICGNLFLWIAGKTAKIAKIRKLTFEREKLYCVARNFWSNISLTIPRLTNLGAAAPEG